MFLRFSGKSISQSSTVLGCFEESRANGSIGAWAEEMKRESSSQPLGSCMRCPPWLEACEWTTWEDMVTRMCLWTHPQNLEGLSTGDVIVNNITRGGICTLGSNQTGGAGISASPMFLTVSRVAFLLSHPSDLMVSSFSSSWLSVLK